MSDTTLSQTTEFYTLTSILAQGYKVTLMHKGRRFLLVQVGPAIVATVGGESMRFVGCTEREIKQTIFDWVPGAWI